MPEPKRSKFKAIGVNKTAEKEDPKTRFRTVAEKARSKMSSVRAEAQDYPLISQSD